jgi:hypothetical protein
MIDSVFERGVEKLRRGFARKCRSGDQDADTEDIVSKGFCTWQVPKRSLAGIEEGNTSRLQKSYVISVFSAQGGMNGRSISPTHILFKLPPSHSLILSQASTSSTSCVHLRYSYSPEPHSWSDHSASIANNSPPLLTSTVNDSIADSCLDLSVH